MTETIWITGIGLVSSLGEGTELHQAALAGAAPVVDTEEFRTLPGASPARPRPRPADTEEG
ncbi:hypothetical protein [Dankookia sp. P2]|uniref:hypothetical protein n=1 Tax=Dankookia sp. P2 TaxID=3423955 RepID=UPI003D66EAC0